MAETDNPDFSAHDRGAHCQMAIGSTCDVVSAYVSNNALPAAELPDLIRRVHATLSSLDIVLTPASTLAAEKATEAQIAASITPDALISFLDGQPYKTIRRHLTTHGLTPEGYRARFGLPVDYPMVSPNYSAARSELAKAAGLGRGGPAPDAEASTSAGASADKPLAA